MEKFYIRLADKNIEIYANYIATKKFCTEYLIGEPKLIDIKAQVNVKDVAVICDELDISVISEYMLGYAEFSALYRVILKQLLLSNTILFHGSAIAVDDEVYIFTAPSGTGKSTHARLWRELLGDRAKMVNDDKPLLRLNQDGSLTVFGTPFSGKHRLSENIALPLKAVCILSQAPENRIQRVSAREALGIIYAQTYFGDAGHRLNEIEAKKTLAVLNGVFQVPIWHLECNVSYEAARLSYETMSGQKIS